MIRSDVTWSGCQSTLRAGGLGPKQKRRERRVRTGRERERLFAEAPRIVCRLRGFHKQRFSPLRAIVPKGQRFAGQRACTDERDLDVPDRGRRGSCTHAGFGGSRNAGGFRVVFDGGGSSLVMARWTRVGSLARLGGGHSLSCRLARSLSHFSSFGAGCTGETSLCLSPPDVARKKKQRLVVGGRKGGMMAWASRVRKKKQ